MNRAELAGIVSQYLPTNVGILLAGSQVINDDFSNTADIDLIVIEASFSHIQSFSLGYNGYKIDLAILPLTNLEAVLSDEANDPRGGLLHMLSNGHAIKDNFGLFPLIREKAQLMTTRIAGKTIPVYERKMAELANYGKYFSKSLSKEQKNLLLCDVVAAISTAEAIKSSTWMSKRDKLALLNEGNGNTVCHELMDIFNKCLQEEKYESLVDFINYYIQTRASLPLHSPLTSSRLLIDIDYPDFSMGDFIGRVLPVIRQAPVAGENFRYFYLSPRHYQKTYQNRVTISFQIKSHDQASNMIRELDTLLDDILTKGRRVSLVYQEPVLYPDQSFQLIEALRISFNLFMVNEINAERSGSVIQIYHSILIAAYVASSLQLSTKDMIKANTFLAQRSLFSPLEQAQLKGFEQLKKMQEMKMQQVMAFFQQHQKGIIDYANDGLLLALGNKTNARADYTVFIKAIEDIISKEDFFGAHDNNLDYLALKRAQCEETYKALLYVTIMDETLLFLNVQEAEKFACLACSSRSMGELKGKES